MIEMKEFKRNKESIDSEFFDDYPGKEEFEQGLHLYKKGEVLKAISIFKSSSYPPAYIYLSHIYRSNFTMDDEFFNLSEKYRKKVAKFLNWFLDYAKKQDAEAQFYLAELYSGEPLSNWDLKLQNCESSAKQGHWIGQYMYGLSGCKKGSEEQLKWLQASAKQGYGLAFYNLATYYDAHRTSKKSEWYEAAAKQGHTGCQYLLGKCYEGGWGVNKDFEKAAQWYEASLGPDFMDPQFRLAILYANGGNGIAKDEKKAIHYFLQLLNHKPYASKSEEEIDSIIKGNKKLKSETITMLLAELKKSSENSRLAGLFKKLTGKKYSDFSKTQEQEAKAILEFGFFPVDVSKIIVDYHKEPLDPVDDNPKNWWRR